MKTRKKRKLSRLRVDFIAQNLKPQINRLKEILDHIEEERAVEKTIKKYKEILKQNRRICTNN